VLARSLTRGGQLLASQQQPDVDGLIDFLFQSTLTRDPTGGERKALQELFGAEVTAEAIEDALWALCMTPEFLLIR
jgi:hypothetical protein